MALYNIWQLLFLKVHRIIPLKPEIAKCQNCSISSTQSDIMSYYALYRPFIYQNVRDCGPDRFDHEPAS